MSNNFFNQDDDDGSEFRDIPEEVSGGQAEVPNVRVNRPAAPPQPVQQEPEIQYEEEVQADEEEDFSSVLSDARSRMEQGRLYEMIMDHDIFAGADADEKAIKYVTKQIRNFAKEQMEIMLGMRQEKQEVQALAASDFPFNDLEVAALKDLAYMATKGASARDEAQTFTPQATPVAPRRTGLNPIAVKSQVKPAQRAAPAKPAPKPLAQKAAAPVKRDQRTEAQIEQILREEGITREEYERQYPPGYKPLTKPLGQMNEAEIKEWRRQEALKTNKQVKNPTAIPMPTAEQEEMLHTQRAQAAASHPQMQSIMNLLINSKPKQ
ncbi:MAG: hypothetical protein HC840_01105 [Leptolyngbyaceae cyanobacterium RM2_2_4]|nr:hypothetical protein [Leptolyngbyaceae cyanobacterium RM2_2_4]